MFPDTLHTPRLLLRPIAPDDAGPIFTTCAADPEVTRFLTWLPHRSFAETEACVARCLAAATSRTYAMVGGDDGLLRGAFGPRHPEPHRYGYGYVLARSWWGRGLMAEALAAAANWALAQPGVWRIGDCCDVDNLASARVMEKAGLQREGVLRRWVVRPGLDGMPRDCFSYARTR